MTYICKTPSPIGMLTISSDGSNVTGLWLENQKYYAAALTEESREQDLPLFNNVRQWLDCYFSGSEPAITLPLAPQGNPFRQSVWKILCEIPYGAVTTYGAIAKQLAEQNEKKRMSAQAVGGAVGHNPISIIIPCHRVVGSDGSLTGYGGGLYRKIRLLQLEKVNMEKLYVPSKGLKDDMIEP